VTVISFNSQRELNDAQQQFIQKQPLVQKLKHYAPFNAF